MTPTLSRLSSPLSRLAPLRRLPFWAQALALCALFAVVGAAVVDDYGLAGDEITQLHIARANAHYIITGDISELSDESVLVPRDDLGYRYYGVAFEMPLLVVERALGLQGWRQIYLTRHLLTHLFFVMGGFACGMLVYRMMGSRWVALFAMLIFLLHPRLYAHSFFNTKDIPFAAMLAVALYLTHRAFRKDTIGAFLLCGIGVGLAIDLRPFALMLPPAILAMRAPDLWRASGAERKHILITGAALLAAALATAYIVHPYYWENPLRFIDGIRYMSQHPYITENLLMGEIYLSDAVPWNYIPVWFAITAPPIALLLGAIGCAAVCGQAVARPLAALRDREIRFRVLALGCVALPVVVVIILQSNIYHGWRQMYFLWAPFCLLAAIGLHYVANIHMRMGSWKFAARLPLRIRGGGGLDMARRALAYGAAGFGLATTLTAMAALHPHQQVYFNGLVDTDTPGALAERYDMDYWLVAQRQAVEYLLARYPDDTLRVYPRSHAALMLSENDGNRIVFSPAHEADFYVHPRIDSRYLPDLPVFHDIQAYGSRMWHIFAPNSAAYRAAYSAAYSDVASNGTLLALSDFDIYAHNGELHYLNSNCAPLRVNNMDVFARVFLHTVPVNPADLPADRREPGFDNMDFYPLANLTFSDGRCIYKQALPDYPIESIRTGERSNGKTVWRADIDLTDRAASQPVYDGIAAGDYGMRVAQSNFDLYLRDGVLAYIKTPCAPADAEAWFFMHIFPSDPAELPAGRREHGFVNWGFQFADYGLRESDICVATLELPGYAIDRIRTGQNAASGGGDKWSADVSLTAIAAAQATYESVIAGDYGAPVIRSRFDVYMRDRSLAYIKSPCAPADADAGVFLHVFPSDTANLPADRIEYGFISMSFRFADHGAYEGDICVATLELPDYEIERFRTGQDDESSGGDEWRAAVNLTAFAAAQDVYDGIAAGAYGAPVAESRFDVYMRDNALAYIKDRCVRSDVADTFFLHIIPANPEDLPADRRERGFVNIDFRFADHGARIGDKCVATLDLPDSNYAIDRIRTGQFVSWEGELWRVEFAAGE